MPRSLGEIFPLGQSPGTDLSPQSPRAVPDPRYDVTQPGVNRSLQQTQECKRYGAPRGCDVSQARKAHIERERAKWVQPRIPEFATGKGTGKLPPLDPSKPEVVDQTLKEASLGVLITSKVVNLVQQALGSVAQRDFERGVKSATDKINNSQQRVMDADARLNSNMAEYYGKNATAGQIAEQLLPVQQTLSRQASQLQSLNQVLAGLYPQQSALSASVAEAQARLDYTLKRSNYPMTTAGVTQQKNESRAANYDLMTKSFSLNDVNNQIYLNSQQYNEVGNQYNATLPVAQGMSREIEGISASARQNLENANRAQSDKNVALNQTGEGVNDIKNLAKDFRNYQNNVLLPLREASLGLGGFSQVLDSASREQYFTTTTDTMTMGLGAVARLSAPSFPLADPLLGLASSALRSGGESLDATVARGGSLDEAGKRFVSDFAQATIRLNSAIQVAQNISLASDIFNNATNPTRVYDGMTVLSDQVAPAVSVVTKTLQTVAPFVPPLAAVTPMIPAVGNALGTALEGTVQTMTEVFNKAKKYGGLDAPINRERTPMPGTRQLYKDVAGEPGALSTGIFGGVGTLFEAAWDFTKGFFEQQPQQASRASQIVESIAKTGTSEVKWSPPINPDDLKMKADPALVEQRPPVPMPVTPPSAIVGD